MKTSAAKNILVVDDEDFIRVAVSELLRSRGYQAFSAATAAQTLSILTEHNIDLVVLDVELGNENGLELLATIKATHPETRVVMLTGRGYEDALWETARKNGADGYVSKHLPPTQLLMEINRWMKHQKRTDSFGQSSPSPQV